MYLYRTLKALLTIPGANVSQTLVFIDGFFQEPVDVAKMLGVRAFNHEPASQKNGRISQHYKASLTKTFDVFPVSILCSIYTLYYKIILGNFMQYIL